MGSKIAVCPSKGELVYGVYVESVTLSTCGKDPMVVVGKAGNWGCRGRRVS
jgi:hypothetical protein